MASGTSNGVIEPMPYNKLSKEDRHRVTLNNQNRSTGMEPDFVLPSNSKVRAVLPSYPARFAGLNPMTDVNAVPIEDAPTTTWEWRCRST